MSVKPTVIDFPQTRSSLILSLLKNNEQMITDKNAGSSSEIQTGLVKGKTGTASVKNSKLLFSGSELPLDLNNSVIEFEFPEMTFASNSEKNYEKNLSAPVESSDILSVLNDATTDNGGQLHSLTSELIGENLVYSDENDALQREQSSELILTTLPENENETVLIEIGVVSDSAVGLNCKLQETNDVGSEAHKENYNQTTKRGTKRLRKLPIKLSSEQKKQNHRKNLKEKHSTRAPCTNCRYKCVDSFSEAWRKSLNSEFWDKDWKGRRDFILLCVVKLPVKRRRGLSEVRNNSFQYFFTNTTGSKIRVCKKFFLTTLGFTCENNSVVHDTLTYVNAESMTGLSSKNEDGRGRHSNHNKFDRKTIVSHIESFNPSVSHYRRAHAPLRRYLPNDITIHSMYEHFLKTHSSAKCSYDLYRKVLRELNISFTKLGHEECERCFTFKEHKQGHNESNIFPDCSQCVEFENHQKTVKKARQLYQTHADISQNDTSTIYFCADLQKVIMLPRMDTFKEVVFTRRLVTFNESFVPLGKKPKLSPMAVIWHEAITGRKKEDIISSFYAFFLSFRDTESVTLWLDNCSSQNKNWTLFSFFVYLVNNCPHVSINKIEICYFEPGHTFMAADSFHHQVEMAMKHYGKIYDFHDFENCVKKSNSGKNEVKVLWINDIFKWKNFTCHYKLKQLGTAKPLLKDIVKITVERGQMFCKYAIDHDEPADKKLNFLQASVMKNGIPQPLPCESLRGVNKFKKEDIVKKICPLMPENRRAFWENLSETDLPDLITELPEGCEKDEDK